MKTLIVACREQAVALLARPACIEIFGADCAPASGRSAAGGAAVAAGTNATNA